MVQCHGGFSWLFRPLFRRLLNLSWTGASLLKGLQSARSRLLHQNCTRNAKPFAQCQNVNFFKTPAQLLYHIVQCARTKGEAGTKVKPLGQLTFALKISISPFNLKGGWIFLQGFCKTILFSLPSDKEEMIGSAFVSLQYRHLKSEWKPSVECLPFCKYLHTYSHFPP